MMSAAEEAADGAAAAMEPAPPFPPAAPPFPPAAPPLRLAATGGVTLPPDVPPALPPMHPAAPEERPAPAGVGAAAGGGEAEEEEGIPEGTWHCHKCGRRSLPTKARCSSCQAWRGGRREGYGHKRPRPPAPRPGEPWACPCGHPNSATKARCGRCQKWKGGRRDNMRAPSKQSTPGAAGTADATTEGAGANENREEEAWTCDRCGAPNGPRKVRCHACPRWRDGKRPAFRKKFERELTKRIVELTSPPAAGAAGGSNGFGTGGAGGHDIGMGTAATGHVAGHATMGVAARPLGSGWLCAGCSHPNAANKRRCGSCQRWKFGKRDNMRKANRMSAVDPVGTNGGMAGATAGGAAGMPGATAGVPQQVAMGNAGGAVPGPMAAERHWACPCGHANLDRQSRCSSCQGWRGGKRGSLPRKPRPLVGEVGGPDDVSPPHRPNARWECGRCGHENGFRKLRCGQCSSWKNAKKQRGAPPSGTGAPAAFPPVMETIAAARRHAAPLPLPRAAVPSPARVAPPTDWPCHGCGAAVPGSKHRCPSCKCWRGGVRSGLKKPVEMWTCGKCGVQNKERNVRCGACQGWRDGRRPGSLRGGEAQQLPRGAWACDRCQKSNKASKARCGGCQRWRGGQRPDIRKSARPPPPLPAQLPVPPPLPMGVPPAAVAGPGLLGPTPGNAAGAARMPVQNPMPPAHAPTTVATHAPTTVAKAPVPNDVMHWTCNKCTCDNLATESKCKICDCPRGNWV